MEAYLLCAKDLFRKLSTKKTGIRIGWINCVIFGLASVLLSSWAVYGLFHPYKYNPYYDQWRALTNVFERNWFCYVYLFYCFFMFAAGFFFIIGVKRSHLRKLLPFLLLSLVGIKFSPDFLETIDYAVSNNFVVNKTSLFLVVLHVISCIWSLTHYLQLKYTPEKLNSYGNVHQTLYLK